MSRVGAAPDAVDVGLPAAQTGKLALKDTRILPLVRASVVDGVEAAPDTV